MWRAVYIQGSKQHLTKLSKSRITMSKCIISPIDGIRKDHYCYENSSSPMSDNLSRNLFIINPP